MTLFVRLLLIAVPYAALACLALTWIAAVYFYKDERVAVHVKWAIPVLLAYSTILHLRRKRA
jgi:hypothetical protein